MCGSRPIELEQAGDESLSVLCRTVLKTEMTQSCVNSWEKHPMLCFVKKKKSDKNNTKNPAVGYALKGSVVPGQQGHCQAEPDLQPTHRASIFAPVLSCFDRKQEMITRGCANKQSPPPTRGRAVFVLRWTSVFFGGPRIQTDER